MRGKQSHTPLCPLAGGCPTLTNMLVIVVGGIPIGALRCCWVWLGWVGVNE